MTDQESLHDKFERFQNATELSSRDAAKIFLVSSGTIQEIRNKVPNSGEKSNILQTLKIFELFPEAAGIWVGPHITRLTPDGQKKVWRYLSNINCNNSEYLKQINAIHNATISAIKQILHRVTKGGDEGSKETNFNTIKGFIDSLDYDSWNRLATEKARPRKKEND